MFYSAFQRYIQIGCIGRLKNKSVKIIIIESEFNFNGGVASNQINVFY